MIKKIATVGILLAATAAPISNANAGGLLGDVLNVFVPGAGTALDEVHRSFKDANPKYKAREERLTNDVRQGIGLKPHRSYSSSSSGRYTIEP